MTNVGSGAGTTAQGDPIDLTNEPDLSSLSVLGTGVAASGGTGAALGAPTFAQSRWWDDAARVILAFILVGLLAFVVILTSIYAVSASAKQEATIESYLKIVLSPIIGIVGSVVGFYFGAKSSQGSG
jgi:hypothetical protein